MIFCLHSGAVEVIPIVDADLKRMAQRVVEKAKDMCRKKMVMIICIRKAVQQLRWYKSWGVSQGLGLWSLRQEPCLLCTHPLALLNYRIIWKTKLRKKERKSKRDLHTCSSHDPFVIEKRKINLKRVLPFSSLGYIITNLDSEIVCMNYIISLLMLGFTIKSYPALHKLH